MSQRLFFAILVALALGWLSGANDLIEFTAFGKHVQVTPLKVIIGMLIITFVILELSPKFSAQAIEQKLLPQAICSVDFLVGYLGIKAYSEACF